MQRSNSFGTSWADQWDTGADPSPRARGGNGGGDGKKVQGGGDGKKVQGGGVERTKAAAATGLKKVKAGTAQGFQWIKDKYQKKSAGKNGKQGGGSEVAAGY